MLRRMMKDKFPCMLFAVGALLFASCASGPRMTTVPLTPTLIEVLGLENMGKAAYFLSKKVELMRKDYLPETEVSFQAGDVHLIDKDIRDIIRIGPKTRGAETVNLFMQVAFVNYQVVGIEFEDEVKAKMGFTVDLREPEGRFELQFDDEKAKTVRYGDYDYYVRYKDDGKGRPYLMVRVARSVARENMRRKAAGKVFE